MSSSPNSSALRGTPRLPAITMPTAVALAQMQPSTTQQSAVGSGTRFTPPFTHPGAPSNGHNSTGGFNWRHWGQLYAEQDRSPLPPTRSSSGMGTQTAAPPMPHHRPHPAFSTGSKDSIMSNGLTLLAETLACLDGPTPPPPASGRFVGDGGTNGTSLLYRDGEGALRGLTPIPVIVPSVKPAAKPAPHPAAATSSTSTHVPAAAALPKPGSGKVNHPGALDIYQDVTLSTSTNASGPAAKSHTPGALLRIDNGSSNFPVTKGRKKGRKAADAFPKSMRRKVVVAAKSPVAPRATTSRRRGRRRRGGRRRRMIFCAEQSRPIPTPRPTGRVSRLLTSPDHEMQVTAGRDTASTPIQRSARSPLLPRRTGSSSRNWSRANHLLISPSFCQAVSRSRSDAVGKAFGRKQRALGLRTRSRFLSKSIVSMATTGP